MFEEFDDFLEDDFEKEEDERFHIKNSRYYKDRDYQKHLKNIAEAKYNRYICPAYKVTRKKVVCPYVGKPWKWIWIDIKPYYKRLYRGRRSSYYKKESNRRVRRQKEMLYQNGLYKKVYDVKWNMY